MDDYTRVNPTAEIMGALQSAYLELNPALTPTAMVGFLNRFFDDVTLKYSPESFANQDLLTMSDSLEDQKATMWAYRGKGQWAAINGEYNLFDWYKATAVPVFMRVFLPLDWVPVGTHKAEYRTA